MRILGRFNPALLTGPIFDKELRVSSRKRRNYILRLVYILVLTVFVFIALSSMSSLRINLASIVAQMSEAGKAVTATIIWYQFVLLQLIAVVMMSNSISDEIYHKTLGLLMTTPITSFQIVSGKLLSKLLQLFLLLAISFPLLAILRIFGGVPWNYVLSSFCITLTAVLFAGALSMYYSIKSRYAYVVILKTIFVLGIIYFFIPFFSGTLLFYILFRSYFLFSPLPYTVFLDIVGYFNPFLVMITNTYVSLFQITTFPTSPAIWPVHCLIMIILTLLVTALSIRVVRKVALRQATGQLDYFRRKPVQEQQSPAQQNNRKKRITPIREVKGEPVIWKEMMESLVEGGRKKAVFALIVAIIALLVSYYTNSIRGGLRENFAHVGYSLIFVLLALVTNVALSATSITSEKESMSWPILLTTPLDDWQIVIGKAVGSFRRCLPIWFFLAGHLLLFTLLGYIHPAAIIHLGLIIGGVLIFLNGSGLYFSSRFRHTTAAVVANFSFVLLLWAIIPLISDIAFTSRTYPNLRGFPVSANPVYQTIVVMRADSGVELAGNSILNLEYEWPFRACKTFFSTTAMLLGFLIFYSALGLFFAWRAKCNIRRNIF